MAVTVNTPTDTPNTNTPNDNNDTNSDKEPYSEPDEVEEYDVIKVDANANTRSWGFVVWPGKENPVPPEDRLPELKAYFERGRPKVMYLNAALEHGERDGNPHLQGCIIFQNAMSFERLRKALPFLHGLTPRHKRSTDWRLANYNLKGDQPKQEWLKDHESGVNWGRNLGVHISLGTFPKQAAPGSRTDCIKVKRALDSGVSCVELAKDDETHAYWMKYRKNMEEYASILRPPYTHHDTRGLWIIGKAGVGKSLAMRTVFGDSLYTKDFNYWFDHYAGETAILIDDLSGGLDCYSMQEYLKKWSDRYPLQGQTKGGHVSLQHKILMVTSQYTPREILLRSFNRKHPFWADSYKRGKRADWRALNPPTAENPHPVCPPIEVPDPPLDEEFLEAIDRRFPIVRVDMDNEEEVIECLKAYKDYHFCSEEQAEFHLQAATKRRTEHKMKRREWLDKGYRKCDIEDLIKMQARLDKTEDPLCKQEIQDEIDAVPRNSSYHPPSMPNIPHLLTQENINDPPPSVTLQPPRPPNRPAVTPVTFNNHVGPPANRQTETHRRYVLEQTNLRLAENTPLRQPPRDHRPITGDRGGKRLRVDTTVPAIVDTDMTQ